MIAGDVDRDVGVTPAFLECKNDLARDEGVAEQPLQPGELPVDESANPRGDVDLTACEDESHEAMRPIRTPARRVIRS